MNRLELVRGEPDPDPAVEHARRGRQRSGVPHRLLACEADLDPVGRGEAVGDEGGLEGDDRRALVERGANLVGEVDQVSRGRR